MHSLDFNAAKDVADQIQTTHEALDGAILHFVKLAESVLDAGRRSELPAAANQKAIEAATTAMSSICGARRDFVAVHREVATIKSKSNLREVGFGCLGDSPLTKGHDRLRVVA